MPQRGWDTVTIPGAVSGWVALSQRFGKLPFADLFEPAIRYARDGYLGVAGRRREMARSPCRCCRSDLGWRGALPAARPRAARRASASRRQAMAATLEKIAATRGEAFYRGELAESDGPRIRSAHGGAHTLDDFAAHTVDWVDAARAATTAASRCTRFRPTARASPR